MNDLNILLTGGDGKTARRIAGQLQSRGIDARRSSRTGKTRDGMDATRFDWADQSTHEAALSGIHSVYLVAPSNVADPLAAMVPFLRRAFTLGVRRFVLLSASALPEGGPMMGQVHAFLHTEAPVWIVLRPTWFMQNFSEQQHLPTIRDESAIYTASGSGRIPFIHAEDIAAAAVAALLGESPENCDLVLTGPRALSYDEVAAIISRAVDRPIRHRSLPEAELRQMFVDKGMESSYAASLARMDTSIANGSEDRVTDTIAKITGREPITFEEFAAQSAAVWKQPTEAPASV